MFLSLLFLVMIFFLSVFAVHDGSLRTFKFRTKKGDQISTVFGNIQAPYGFQLTSFIEFVVVLLVCGDDEDHQSTVYPSGPHDSKGRS